MKLVVLIPLTFALIFLLVAVWPESHLFPSRELGRHATCGAIAFCICLVLTVINWQ